MDLVAFTLEEPPYYDTPRMGSRVHAEALKRQGAVVRAMIALEMKRSMQAATPLQVYSMNAPAWIPGIDFSDHRSYWAHGYPAVMITDTAFYRNDRYHTARDTPDTLDYGRMAEVVRGIHAAVCALAR